MPLFGIDWQIDKKNCLFGVLPGNLIFQHFASPMLAYGVSFRAQTNSYNKPSANFIRFDENQLGGFLDFYLQKHVVMNLEAGHSMLRQIRTGKLKDCNCKGRYIDLKANDNIYLKLSLAYRIALR